MAHAPDVIAASQALGRSVEDVGRTFSLLEDRAGIAWIEEQLGELPVSTRLQRWALQALRDDLWRARRDLAQRALEESAGAPVQDAVAAFVDARPDAMRRLADLARTMAGEGGADLAGLTLAVRQLRALAS
jgi:glutamate dehydrogenase